ncbi:UNVERIFIED_CONTAM: Selenium-binding protein 2 [Sesamum calycinum]|uniref:Selenium-binding protein 2 n=1 Tax=Sesamum calycinum TaxID=2727403 RepID=A0AAW2RRL8_9LAMI
MTTDLVAVQHTMAENDCCKKGPGYAFPLDAMSGPRETLLYVTCFYTGTGRQKADYLATVDVDPSSPTYSKVVHRLRMPYVGDELHHSGWNACSSCHADPLAARRFLVLPCLLSGRIYVTDIQKDLKAPTLHKVIEPHDIIEKTGLGYPHTAHCLASGDIMVSCLGDKEGNAQGSGFLLLDSNFNVKGRWEKAGHSPLFGYDFWYQPRHKIMISSSFGAPAAFTKGFDLQHVSDGLYGRHLHIYSWPEGELKQTLDLGNAGLIPLEIRFLHNPNKDTGFVGCALGSNVVRFFKNSDGSWDHENWILPEMPSATVFVLISLDDRFLYLSNWFHGDIRQYNIQDPANPKLTGQVWLGGLIQKGSPVVAEAEDGTTFQIDVLEVQFYPEVVEKGGHMLQIDVDTEKGGLAINPNFYVDFGPEPDGPSLAHEIRYPAKYSEVISLAPLEHLSFLEKKIATENNKYS